jgi:hypothetical protein
MAGQLIPPPEFAPTPPTNSTPEERLAMCLDLSRSCEALFLSGLRARIGPGGDAAAEYRRWYRNRSEHDLRQRLARAKELEGRDVEDGP